MAPGSGHPQDCKRDSLRRGPILGRRQEDIPIESAHFVSLRTKTTPSPAHLSEIKHIERALIEVHADNYLTDRSIDQAPVLRLLELLCPATTDILPSRRVLGSRILKEHALWCKTANTEALKSMEQRTNGWVNLLSDVWQISLKITYWDANLPFRGNTYLWAYTCWGRTPRGSYSRAIRTSSSASTDGEVACWSHCPDNAGQCGRARRILALRWSQIIFVFCFAHDVNNLMMAVLQSPFSDVAAQAATTVKTLNASSSKWLPRARKLMQRVNRKHIGLRTLCQTRWNSMQGCFASLLRVQSALQLLFHQHRNDSDFPENLRVFGENVFWVELKEAEAIIAPLSYASYRLQRDQNTVGDVVLSLRDIYKGFKQHIVRHDELVERVEYRWAQIEQSLFMLGFALHPCYVNLARELPNISVSGIGAMCKIAVYYYRRLFNAEDIGDIWRDMLSWMKGRFTRTKLSEFVDCPWEYVLNERPNSLLPRLAMRVLSIVVNTATRERRFSELGMIHTAKRNRMSAIKAIDFHIIAQHVRQHTQKEASASKNPKTKLLISPMERTIIIDAAALFTPSPGQHIMTSTHEDSDNEDPEDGVDGAEPCRYGINFSMKYLMMKKIDAGYAVTQGTASTVEPIGVSERHQLSGCDVDNDSDEFEIVPESNRVDFPQDSYRNFPQESVRLPGFRGQKVLRAELFG
ncbi:Hypothetical protein PHPALM_369 [Phytophthora palmivora]|uniref:HAT C-terminal dimerisation domain-containing protein n=1 Tax=Phytophthora palmivora TaxID=4796 RepID=A0A2P4YV14_9STRA|nr:Hypothetical protein PHPALM_369 [Phytophthora palmivora]